MTMHNKVLALNAQDPGSFDHHSGDHCQTLLGLYTKKETFFQYIYLIKS